MTKLRVILIPSNSGEVSPLLWETLRFTQGDGYSYLSMIPELAEVKHPLYFGRPPESIGAGFRFTQGDGYSYLSMIPELAGQAVPRYQ